MIGTLEHNTTAVRAAITRAATASGRVAADVTIVAVSKTFPRADVDAAYAAGLRVFGENRVQEAATKFASPLPHDASIHLIGQLQTNKVKPALAFANCIESVDRMSLVDALEKEAAKRDRLLQVLVQVNIAREEQKSGCAPEDVAALVERIRESAHLRCDGFMTIAPLVADPELTRPTFSRLRELRDRQGSPEEFPVLSMGMSNDFAIAISEGATHVRLGRAIFGNRDMPVQ